MPVSDCHLVWDILDMFRMINSGVEKLGGIDYVRELDDKADRLIFAGFDFNDQREHKTMSYAEHLAKTDRWDEFEIKNSHMPVLRRYLRMLATYNDQFAPN